MGSSSFYFLSYVTLFNLAIGAEPFFHQLSAKGIVSIYLFVRIAVKRLLTVIGRGICILCFYFNELQGWFTHFNLYQYFELVEQKVSTQSIFGDPN